MRAFSLTTLVAQRDAGQGDGRFGQPFTAAPWRPGPWRSALPPRSPAWPSAGCGARRWSEADACLRSGSRSWAPAASGSSWPGSRRWPFASW